MEPSPTGQMPKRQRIDRQLLGEPISVGDRTIQPVARMGGWYGSQYGPTGGGAGAWLRLSPVEVIVQESDGSERRVPVTDPTREAMRAIAQSGLIVAGLCWLIMLALWLRRRKKR